LYITIFPSIMAGNWMSAKLGISLLQNKAIDSMQLYSCIGIGLAAFCVGLFILYKTLRPYGRNLLLAIEPEENLLFDGNAHPLDKITMKLIVSVSLSSFLIGFGDFIPILLVGILFGLISRILP